MTIKILLTSKDLGRQNDPKQRQQHDKPHTGMKASAKTGILKNCISSFGLGHLDLFV